MSQKKKKIYSIITFDPGNDGGVGHALLRINKEEGSSLEPITVWPMPYITERVERTANKRWNKQNPDKRKKSEYYNRKGIDHRGLALILKDIVKHTRRLEQSLLGQGKIPVPIISFVEKVNPYSYFFGGNKKKAPAGPQRSDPWSMQSSPEEYQAEPPEPPQGNIFQSPHQVWAFAGSVHSIRQALADYNIKAIEVTPQSWQKQSCPGLPKRSAKTEAMRNNKMAVQLTSLFPMFPFPKRSPRARTLHPGVVVAGLLFDYARHYLLKHHMAQA